MEYRLFRDETNLQSRGIIYWIWVNVNSTKQNPWNMTSTKLGYWWVLTSKPVEVRFLITDLPTLVERKLKQTDIDDRPEPLSSPSHSGK